jgi:hypothetical protein
MNAIQTVVELATRLQGNMYMAKAAVSGERIWLAFEFPEKENVTDFWELLHRSHVGELVRIPKRDKECHSVEVMV